MNTLSNNSINRMAIKEKQNKICIYFRPRQNRIWFVPLVLFSIKT
jgi:hypothetical protein